MPYYIESNMEVIYISDSEEEAPIMIDEQYYLMEHPQPPIGNTSHAISQNIITDIRKPRYITWYNADNSIKKIEELII